MREEMERQEMLRIAQAKRQEKIDDARRKRQILEQVQSCSWPSALSFCRDYCLALPAFVQPLYSLCTGLPCLALPRLASPVLSIGFDTTLPVATNSSRLKPTGPPSEPRLRQPSKPAAPQPRPPQAPPSRVNNTPRLRFRSDPHPSLTTSQAAMSWLGGLGPADVWFCYSHDAVPCGHVGRRDCASCQRDGARPERRQAELSLPTADVYCRRC